jgi:hypothetical protein
MLYVACGIFDFAAANEELVSEATEQYYSLREEHLWRVSILPSVNLGIL